MEFEGKAVTLQERLEDPDCSQGQQWEIYRGKAFNLGRAGLQAKLEAKYTLKAQLLYASFRSRADLAHLDSLKACVALSMYTLILYHPLKAEDEMGLLHDFGSTLQRHTQAAE